MPVMRLEGVLHHNRAVAVPPDFDAGPAVATHGGSSHHWRGPNPPRPHSGGYSQSVACSRGSFARVLASARYDTRPGDGHRSMAWRIRWLIVINWIPVDGSSRIVAEAYDLQTETILVRFPDGIEWSYSACPLSVWEEFTAPNQSRGQYIAHVLDANPNSRWN